MSDLFNKDLSRGRTAYVDLVERKRKLYIPYSSHTNTVMHCLCYIYSFWITISIITRIYYNIYIYTYIRRKTLWLLFAILCFSVYKYLLYLFSSFCRNTVPVLKL